VCHDFGSGSGSIGNKSVAVTLSLLPITRSNDCRKQFERNINAEFIANSHALFVVIVCNWVKGNQLAVTLTV